jgi:hypothetical protein
MFYSHNLPADMGYEPANPHTTDESYCVVHEARLCVFRTSAALCISLFSLPRSSAVKTWHCRQRFTVTPH